jgi:hypothetical protein
VKISEGLNLEPHEAFAIALDALSIGRPLPSVVARWLFDGFDMYAKGEAPTLEMALQLEVGPGGAYRKLHRLIPRMRRDRALCAVAAELSGSLPSRAHQLSKAIQGNDYAELPPHCRETLKRIMREYPDLPKSRTQIQRILEGDSVARRVTSCSDNPDYSNKAFTPTNCNSNINPYTNRHAGGEYD